MGQCLAPKAGHAVRMRGSVCQRKGFRAGSACPGICTLLVEKYSQVSLFTVGGFYSHRKH